MKKVKPLRKHLSHFFDSLRIHVKGGTGGQGIPQKGGIGGRGGDVIVKGKKDYTLKELAQENPTKRYTAEAGTGARFFNLIGEFGKSTTIEIPLGVTVLSEGGAKMGEVNEESDSVIVAKGGAGGCAHNGYCGEKGQAQSITLDLKLIADVGFVGFPNAGKSTLLRALSRARPKIASYPFTTIRPNIGTIEYDDYRQISLADLPGLIEGSHINVGMGHKFLKHVERTKLLLFVVDLHGFQLGPKYPFRSALETIILLNQELELYKSDLLNKPAILALNKCDLRGSYPLIEAVKDVFDPKAPPGRLEEFIAKSNPKSKLVIPDKVIRFDEIVPISAKADRRSVTILKEHVRMAIDVNEELIRQSLS